MACVLSLVLTASGFKGITLIVIGSVIVGVWMAVSPALLQPFVRKITGSDQFALGHFGSIGFLIAALIGKYFGNRKKTTEDISVPKQLGFLSDSSVAVSLTMAVLFLLIAVFAGPETVENTIIRWDKFSCIFCHTSDYICCRCLCCYGRSKFTHIGNRTCI